MNSRNFTGSSSLLKLAERLRHYKPIDQQIESSSHDQNLIGSERIDCDGQVIIVTSNDKSTSGRAAVLVCLFEDQHGDIRVILTKRSSNLSSHSGEVSLPGGKVDEDDADIVDTALREAKEEIGLDPGLVHIVTVLEPIVSKKRMIVTPVIGILGNKDAYSPVANAAEVENIFDAPLEMFLKDENRRETEQVWMGQNYLLHFFDYEVENKKFVIWAMTAGILIRVASIVYQRPPSFHEMRPPFWRRSRQ
ncbi:phosphatase [Lithospermum erythrorhizon]|uniref:Phosphatase n=1 Tax=Lithospermum erythrorhizon TaxID=34254 RepID=A0AAV3NVR5_LITER